MIIWMRRHARGIKAELEGEAASALATGSTMALVGMAFLAVLREGFETSVFLLAAFQDATDTTAAGAGAVLGLVAAVAIGLGLYRGGVRINLHRFFRVTGLVLVFVAAGLLATAAHTAHEAGWINGLQGQALDLTWLVQPGTVSGSLLTGMLGLQPQPTVVEAAAYLLYAVPMALYVLWPDRLRPRGARRSGPPAKRRVRRSCRREPGMSSPIPLTMSPITRRRLLASAGVGAAGIGLGGATGFLVGQDSAEADVEGTGTVAFYGEHQAGIDTPAQDRLHFAAFDLVTESRAELRELLREWSRAAVEMTDGQMIGDVNRRAGGAARRHRRDGRPAPLQPHRHLRLRARASSNAAGSASPPSVRRRCASSRRCPATSSIAAESGGDLCVQACADDPQVAFHAIRNLARIGRGTVVMRWSQLGFGRTSSTSRSQATPRNLMGMKDGTANIRAEDTEAMNRFVWLGDGDGPGLDARRQLHGEPPHPHAARGLGPLGARRPGADDRPPQVQRRPARGERGVRPARPRRRDGTGNR